jgi:hypothetical protein
MTVVSLDIAYRSFREVLAGSHPPRYAASLKPSSPRFIHSSVAEAQWRDILCIQEERVVAPDNTVAWKRQRLQIPPHPARAHFVRAKVRVHDYPDGELAIFHGPRCLIRWQPGQLADNPEPLRAAA